MQPGQSCSYQAVFTNWDFTLQGHPNTVKDHYGLACADPTDPRTCPKARRCVSADLCFIDAPDWTNNELLDERWGLDVADYVNPADWADFDWPYVTEEYRMTYLKNIDWGIIDADEDRRRLGIQSRPTPTRPWHRSDAGDAPADALTDE